MTPIAAIAAIATDASQSLFCSPRGWAFSTGDGKMQAKQPYSRLMARLLLITLAFSMVACMQSSDVSSATPRASATLIPTPTPTPRIPVAVSVALPFDYHISTDTEEQLGVRLVFGSRFHSLNDGVTRLYYAPYDRETDPTSHDLAWFQENHPDWIEYRADRTTIAYEFGDSNVPLDITNPAVMRYLENTYYLAALKTGGYQGISFDNISFQNDGDWTGMRAGHYDLSGAWVQQFTTQADDPAYRQAVLHWEQTTYHWLHATAPGAVMAINFWYDHVFSADSLALWSNTDVMVDEAGWTNGAMTPPIVTGVVWLQTAQWVEAGTAQGKRIFMIDEEPVPFAQLSQAQAQWAIANYLVTSSGAGWMYICGAQQYGYAYTRPEYSAPIGTPAGPMVQDASGAYLRTFSHGLALVNPSSTQSAQVALPANSYEDLYGQTIASASVTLAPTSGLVLQRI